MTLVLYSAAENTYCVIKVEGESLRSETVVGSASPTFHLEGVFFRYDVCKAIEIQVSHCWWLSEWYLRFNWNNVLCCFIQLWESRWLRDNFLGCAVVAAGSADNQTVSIKSPLVGRGLKREDRHPGEVTISLVTFDDLNAA
jgi:hypothetical protein